ncbi:hypothetical protein ANN_20695 [Periplaneta americana]|uniref:Kynurenine formamidase n=1 Tax=Periplaneta americana TaxID=6978 RepID=A0ABQ8SEF5_PERAM|nr:hypothetical protein ANN_20695 [Periplaneta americana]
MAAVASLLQDQSVSISRPYADSEEDLVPIRSFTCFKTLLLSLAASALSEKLKLNSPTTNDFQTMDQMQLEHQYSPSRWSHRFQDPDDVIQHHIDFITKGEHVELKQSLKKRLLFAVGECTNVEGELFVITGAPLLASFSILFSCLQQARMQGQGYPSSVECDMAQRLTNNWTCLEGNHCQMSPKHNWEYVNYAPILVYIHGGYWQELSRCTSAYCVEPQYRNGVRTVILGYDLAPTVEMFRVIEHSADCEMRSVICFLNARNIKPADIHRQLCEVYGDDANSDGMVRRWPHTAQFLGGQRFDGDDEVKTAVREWFASQAGKFYNEGIERLAPRLDKCLDNITLREIVEEIKTGAEYVVNMAVNLGARSVWFAGHSAGAHLVSMLLFSGWLNQLDDRRRNLVKGFVLISGVYDLIPLINTYVNDNLKLSREEARVLSPMLLNIESLSVRKLKILVAVAEFDSPEFQRQSQTFFEKLEQKSTMLEFITVPGVDHFDIVENLHKEDFVLTKKITELIARD